MYNDKLFQPARLDFWTFIHFIGSFSLTSVLSILTISPFASALIALVWGMSWEYAQATADNSQEGIDPLDLVADIAGVVLAFIMLTI